MNKLILLDGHNLLFKSYAVPFKYYSKKGTPLHVVTTFLGLIRRVFKILEVDGSDYCAIVFDSQSINTNRELSPKYKANRKYDYSNDEDSPFHHLPLIQKALNHLGLFYVESIGYEADDVIATMANKFIYNKNDGHVYIVSTDSDFYQLLSKNISVLRLKRKGAYNIFTHQMFMFEYEINVSDYVLYKSLIGDKTDNIEGLRGIGPVTAKKIIQKKVPFDANQYKEILELNRKLITLDCNTPFTFNQDACAINFDKTLQSNKIIYEVCCF